MSGPTDWIQRYLKPYLYTNPDLAFAKTLANESLPTRRVLDRFTRSQHRPSLITTPSLIQAVGGRPVRRWNFRKANWTDFKKEVETVAATLPLPTPTNLNEAYDDYSKMLLNSASKHIPRGRREAYIPCWDEECEDLLLAHKDANSNEERDTAANDLHNRLNEKRRERGTDMVESIDFTHSSRRAWHTINKITGGINTSPPCPITANSIATTLVRNGRFPNADKTFARQTTSNVHKLRRAPSVVSNLPGEFSPEEMKTALKHLKSGKSPGLDNIHPEFLLNQGVKATEWLRLFCSQCLHSRRFPKIWRLSKVIAIHKPNKPLDDPKGYRPIALLCVPYKFLERLLHTRFDPVIDPQLPCE